MDEMKMIKERHSVRQYEERPIAEDLLLLIHQKLNEICQESGLKIQYFSESKNAFRRGMLAVVGWKYIPGYFAIAGPDDDLLAEKAGYYGEKLVLFLQSIGLRTCWIGMFKKDAVPMDLKDGERIAITIVAGYGKNDGKTRKSKSIEEVTDVPVAEMPEWFRAGVEAALLAPTAVNQQRFRILLHDGAEEIISTANGKNGDVDLGIVKYHFEVAKKA